MLSLDKNSSSPLYIQLIEILIDTIQNELKPNDRLLSEREILDKYNVSRTTVRQALNELENMGWIYKRHGKGTYVSALNRNKQNLVDSYSFTDQMKKIGKTPTTKVLSFNTINSNRYVSDKMALKNNELIYKIKRLRLANGIPMMLETDYIPIKYFPSLSIEMIRSKPLYDLFENDYNQKIAVAEEEFSAGIISEKDSKYLEISPNSPAIILKRSTFNQYNDVIEFTISTVRSDMFVYKIRHVR